jgi:MFS family permease
MSSEHDTSQTSGAFAALLLAVLSFSLLQTMVVPALPDLQRDLGADPTAAAWVISSFLLTSSVGTVLVGRLGDMFGRRRMLVASLVALAAGTLLAALAGSVWVLVAARAVQGLGAGTFPLAFGTVRETFPRDRVPVAIGTISAVFGIGFGVGLVLPGPLIEAFGWPSLFWAALVVILVALGAVLAFVPRDRGRAHLRPADQVSPGPGTDLPDRATAGWARRVDWAGAALLSVALVALLLAISRGPAWGPTAVGALVVVSVLAFVLFGFLEPRLAEPLIDLRVQRRRTLVTVNLAALVIGFGMYGAFTLVPQLVQTPPDAGYGFGATVGESGLYLLPMAATMLVTGPLAGRLGRRFGFPAVLVVACVVGAAGFGLLAAAHQQAWAVAVGSGVIGMGVGLAFSSMANVVVAAVDPAETCEATGINTIVRTIGGALGAQVATAVVVGSVIGDGLPTASGYTIAFWVSAAALAVAAVVVATGTPRAARGTGR